MWLGKSLSNRLTGRTPIGRVMELIRRHGWQPAEMSVLELFGGTGGIHLDDYVDRVRSVVAWEIDPESIAVLQRRFPRIECHQTDTYAAIHSEQRKFDWIISDNPMRQHGEHFEHFDLFPGVSRLCKDSAVMIFSIIPWASKFYLKRYPGLFSREHLDARAVFYGVGNPEKLSPGDFHAAFERHLKEEGRQITWWHVEPRNPLLSYFICGVAKADR